MNLGRGVVYDGNYLEVGRTGVAEGRLAEHVYVSYELPSTL